MSRLKTRRVENVRDVQQFFDATARDYSEQHGNPDSLLRYRLGVIRSLIQPRAQTLLEIGCGTGIHLLALADDFNLAMGTDLSPQMIEKARKNCALLALGSKVQFAVDQAEILQSVANAAVDVVLCVGALEHMRNQQAVFEQVQRVLKSGGSFVCLTPNGNYLWYRYLAPLWGYDTRHLSSDRFVTLACVRKFIAKTPLRLCDSGYWTFIPKGDMGKTPFLILSLLDLIGRTSGIHQCRGGLYFKVVKS